MGCAPSSQSSNDVISKNHSTVSHYDSGKHLRGGKINGDMVVQIRRRKEHHQLKRRKSDGMTVLHAPLKVSAYSRAKPTEDDFRFIEQRIVSDNDSRKTESTTLSSNGTNNSTKTILRSNVKPIGNQLNETRVKMSNLTMNYRQKGGSRTHSTTPTMNALNLTRRLEELNKIRYGKQIRAAEEVRQIVHKESPRIEIVTHCPKEAFMDNTNSGENSLCAKVNVQPNASSSSSQSVASSNRFESLPVQANRKLSQQRSSIIADDSSETSFVVVHKTVKVAWEHEEYKEKAKAERLRKELGLDDSRDSRANGRKCNQTEFVSFDDHISVMESARGSTTNVWSTSSLPGIVNASRIGKSTSNSGAKS